MRTSCSMLAICSALSLMAFSPALGDEPSSAQPYDAEEAFEQLKSLAGEWIENNNPNDAAEEVHFRVIGAGSAVMATFFPGKPMEMISVFHMDGPERLVHTHYCALGNQPMMQFEACDIPNAMNWVFIGGTNFDPEKDLHVHEGIIRVISPDEVESEFTAFSGGKPAGTTKLTLSRKNPSGE